VSKYKLALIYIKFTNQNELSLLIILPSFIKFANLEYYKNLNK